MNDDKMATFHEDPQDAVSGNPIPQEDEKKADATEATDPANADGCTEHSSSDTSLQACASGDPVCTDPAQDSDPDPVTDPAPDPQAELAELRNELKRLRNELMDTKGIWDRAASEYGEFQILYPDTALSSLSDAVWEDVRAGMPLAAAYALAEKRRAHTEALAQASNLQNKSRSTGAVTGAGADYFSPAEVRAMTPAQVRTNYQKIMLSMEKWH